MQKNFKKISRIQIGETSYAVSELDKLNANIVELQDGEFHLLLDNQSIEAELINLDFDNKEIHLRVDGAIYKVELYNALDDLVHELGFDIVDNSVDKNIVAPMPGLVLDIMVEAGQEVEEGQSLLILEAMKMENIIQAPAKATIESISVQKSDSVEKNQLLITLS